MHCYVANEIFELVQPYWRPYAWHKFPSRSFLCLFFPSTSSQRCSSSGWVFLMSFLHLFCSVVYVSLYSTHLDIITISKLLWEARKWDILIDPYCPSSRFHSTFVSNISWLFWILSLTIDKPEKSRSHWPWKGSTDNVQLEQVHLPGKFALTMKMNKIKTFFTCEMPVISLVLVVDGHCHRQLTTDKQVI